ncbi:MAG: GTP 3',8-cyclase MoaA [Gammaproteobacteria bacterium]|nr:GTP 3',8-cyclase MoaA [Gammaproteobacteria bacterium]MCY4218083.1 GTP 3',8-cyclase MoaA [Gammaproteobacteria bacterium]MCY4276062.1 GTP 3',8-cyclase MoaA [Gammaproteobacteria bacterium]
MIANLNEISRTPVTDQFHRPLKDLRISVTDRCNFRCGYCMPKDVFGKNYSFLSSNELLKYEDIERLVKIFTKLGVRKIRLTGGEPLLRKDLEDLIQKIACITGIDDIALTTNASLLSPERAVSLYEAGVNRLNISLDALTPEIYERINQVPVPLKDILEGIKNALQVPYRAIKINMVVQKGVNEGDILKMCQYFRGTGAILRFIEFMDVGNHNQWNLEKVFTAGEMVDVIHPVYPIEPIKANYRGEVSKRWKYLDGQGEVGIIASITKPFCGDCARARLSAKGEIYTCLFASIGYDLRPLLDDQLDDEKILYRLQNLWRARQDRYSMDRLSHDDSKPISRTSQKVEMSYIGG